MPPVLTGQWPVTSRTEPARLPNADRAIVDGVIETPDGRNPQVRTVWMPQREVVVVGRWAGDRP